MTTNIEKIEVKLSLAAKAGLENRVEKLNRRAARLGVPAITFKQTSDWVQEEVRDEITAREILKDFATFEISLNVPKLAGWTFICTLEHTPVGNIVHAVPATSGTIDLEAYRHVPANCDHCNSPRNRKDTYIIRHEDGRMMQVGSSCLADVLGLGITPEEAANWAAWISMLTGAFGSGGSFDDDCLEGCGGNSRPNEMPLLSYLNVAAALVRIDGYRSKKFAEMANTCSTADDVAFHLFPPRMGSKDQSTLKDKYEGNFPVKPTSEDKATAAAALEWAKAIPGKSDFDYNLRILANSEMLHFRNAGLGAYIVPGYLRHLGREAEKKVANANAVPSKHVGTVGTRIKKATVVFVGTPFSGENDYGPFYIHKFKMGADDLVWKTSSDVSSESIGKELVVDFTPKKHAEFNGKAQTEVSRVKFH